jgi:DNA-binding transcriptional ArsR family regulator
MLKLYIYFSTQRCKEWTMARKAFDPRAISEPRHVRLLASPVRHEIVDTLSALGGTASVAELAEQLGRHADGLYYHLRLLCRGGLVREVDGAEGGERLYRLAGTGKAPLRLAYRTGRGGNAPDLARYAHGLLQVAERDFLRALRLPGVAMSGPRRELWAARNKGWIDAADLEEVNRLLERLCDLTSRARGAGRDRLVSLAFVLAPSSRKPKRRGTGAPQA